VGYPVIFQGDGLVVICFVLVHLSAMNVTRHTTRHHAHSCCDVCNGCECSPR
jgi:hypothetical protein